MIFFPISYVFGDILTEVYGYARSRKVVWAGFGALAFASAMSWAVVHLPPAPGVFWSSTFAMPYASPSIDRYRTDRLPGVGSDGSGAPRGFSEFR